MTWIAFIVALAVAQYIVFMGMAGYARGKYKVAAPATTGHELFERHYRVQMNTLEQLVAFIPAIYLAATYASETLAIVCGVLYLLGRGLYAVSYVREPRSRGPGMMLSLLPTMVMVAAALAGIAWSAVGV